MKKLPIGIEVFSEIVQDGYYYVDKTMLVKDLIDLGSKVTLFTRPGRFGKSLNMDMLKSFFETGSDKSIFTGLNNFKTISVSDIGFAGYLTDQCNPDGEIHILVIPNKEIHGIYEKQILSWFRVKVANNARWTVFCQVIENGEALQAEILLNEFMAGSISIHDTCSRQEMKENFYHGMLLGLLNSNETWAVKSNYESGTGYADIIIETGQKGYFLQSGHM